MSKCSGQLIRGLILLLLPGLCLVACETGGDMAILDIEPRLRTVAGFRHLPRLRAALQSSTDRSSKAVA